MAQPEDQARENIDALLDRCGWQVQDKSSVNLQASRGVAVRELSFKTGEPDYTLFVDGKAIGTIEAKPVGHSLIGVEEQSEKYVKGVPFGLPAWRSPLPFSYESTGTETHSANRLEIPLPSLAEQSRIVAEVERRLSVVEELEAVVAANFQRAARLRQAILQRAFEGELVRTEQRETWASSDDLPLAAESPSTYRPSSERTRE